MHFLHRLETEYRLRGAVGACRLVASRIARARADLLFQKDLTELEEDPEGALPALVIDRGNVDDTRVAAVLQAICQGDNQQYLAGLRHEDLLLAAMDDAGGVATYAFVLFRTPYKRVLDISQDTPLIANCYTMPAHRGKRLYPRLLLVTCGELARRGFRLAIISCEPQNHASIRGIERAGFAGVAMIRSVIVLLRIVLFRRVEKYHSWQSRNRARA